MNRKHISRNFVVTLLTIMLLIGTPYLNAMAGSFIYKDLVIDYETPTEEYLEKTARYSEMSDTVNPFVATVEQMHDYIATWRSSNSYDYVTLNAQGEIADEETAVMLAAQIFTEVFDHFCVRNERPFKVYFNENANAWVVRGTLAEGRLGGVACIVLDIETGEIIMLDHGA